MGTYEVEIHEAKTGDYAGKVIFVEKSGERVEIGSTGVSEMKRSVEEEAKGIAKRHRGGPEIVKLDIG